MDLRYSETDQAFRKEIRAWLDDAVRVVRPTAAPGDWDRRRRYDTGWQRLMHERDTPG